MGLKHVQTRLLVEKNTAQKRIQKNSSGHIKVLDVGGNDGKRCREHYPDAEITVLDLKHGWDVMEKGLPEGDWDVIFSNHSLEHFSDPDFFLEECRRVMTPNTVLEIGTPNLAAWYNRILFLLGYVPNHVELSKKYNVGKPFNWGSVPLGGHTFVYTIPALLELLEKYHFKVISVEGELSTYSDNQFIKFLDRFLTRINKNLASAFRVKCTI